MQFDATVRIVPQLNLFDLVPWFILNVDFFGQIEIQSFIIFLSDGFGVLQSLT